MLKLVKPLEEHEIPEVARILANAFCRHNQLVKPIGPSEVVHEKFAVDVANACLSDNLSYAVYDATTMRLIGGCLRARGSNNRYRNVKTPDELGPIYEVLGKLTPPDYIKVADQDKVLEMIMAFALTPEEGGQKGVYEALLRHELQHAKTIGMKYAIVEASSPATQHVLLDRFGFVNEGEVVFAESGVPQYRNIPGKAVLAVLDLEK